MQAEGIPLLRMAIAGLGTAGRLLVPAIEAHPGVRLSAVTDLASDVAGEVARATGAAISSCVEALVERTDVDAIYIASPTEHHAEHAMLAAAAGKHILSEKPMAVDMASAEAMIDDARRAGVVLMVGHSRSYDASFQFMRALIEDGRIGRVATILQLSYSDWIYRPRFPAELDPGQGGGVTYRQGAHQFDVIRLLGGGMVKSVLASGYDLDPERPTIGAHSVLLRFEDGATATAIYNGYGAFSTAELTENIGEWGRAEPLEAMGLARRRHQQAFGDEGEAKRARARGNATLDARHHPIFGLTLVSGALGDMRQSPDGLYLYTAEGRVEQRVPLRPSARDLMLDEFYQAIVLGKRPIHDGAWALANLEVCVAAQESMQTGAEVQLSRQVPVPASRDLSRHHGRNDPIQKDGDNASG